MLTGFYDAAQGMESSRLAYEMIAENLAHLGVPGYRRHEIAFESVPGDINLDLGRIHEEGPRMRTASTDFTPGPLQQTSATLDVAVMGKGFFAVEGPQGEELYTRNGAFSRDADGNLTTQTGLKVIGDGGPITIPPEVSTQAIFIDSEGNLNAKGQSIGKLKLVGFGDTSLLQRVGTTLFRATPGLRPNSDTITVQQGVREMANVSAVTELVNMVSAMRHYEAAQRALKALNDAVQQNTTPS